MDTDTKSEKRRASVTENGASVGEAAPLRAVVDGTFYYFPGCRAVRIGRDEIADYDGRFEYWDADSETALMVAEPTSPYHEQSSVRLARMADRIAATSGTDIEVLGAADLLLRDRDGNRHRIMQADQIVYTRPVRTRPLGHAVEVDADELPDVVLEVDLTTDVRRGKLALYQAWGFQEVWVEVPEKRAPSWPNRKAGLTIYLLGENGYVEVSSSAAFPTWTAAEIHAGMNEQRSQERPMSDATAAVLRRVGRMIRKTTGTGPDNDPFLRMERAESRAEGQAKGHAEGHARGHAEGRVEGRADGRIEGRVETLKEMLVGVFEMRELAMSPKFMDIVEASADLPGKVLLGAAHECGSEEDFVRRVVAARFD